MPAIEPLAQVPRTTHAINFSSSSSWRTVNFASSLCSMGKNVVSLGTQLRNCFSWLKEKFRSYYLRWTCLKDYQTFSVAFEENPFLCVDVLLDTLLKKPEKVAEILPSFFHHVKRSSISKYDSLKVVCSIDGILKKLSRTPELLQVEQDLIDMNEKVPERVLVEGGAKILWNDRNYEEWEINALEVLGHDDKTKFSGFIVSVWKMLKNIHFQNINEIVDLEKNVFEDLGRLLEKQKSPMHEALLEKISPQHKVLLEKIHLLLSDSERRTKIAVALSQTVLWEHNVHNLGGIYKLFQKREN